MKVLSNVTVTHERFILDGKVKPTVQSRNELYYVDIHPSALIWDKLVVVQIQDDIWAYPERLLGQAHQWTDSSVQPLSHLAPHVVV